MQTTYASFRFIVLHTFQNIFSLSESSESSRLKKFFCSQLLVNSVSFFVRGTMVLSKSLLLLELKFELVTSPVLIHQEKNSRI